MNLDELTLGQVKQLQGLLNNQTQSNEGLNTMTGKKVIVRTYSAGCWFGTVVEKSGNEVIVEDARRMYRWQAAKSISLSAVALYGLEEGSSNNKICPSVDAVWLEAIEILPCTDEAIKSLESEKDVEAD